MGFDIVSLCKRDVIGTRRGRHLRWPCGPAPEVEAAQTGHARPSIATAKSHASGGDLTNVMENGCRAPRFRPGHALSRNKECCMFADQPGAACAVAPEFPAEVIQFRRRGESPGDLQAACFHCRQRPTCLPATVADRALHELDGGVLGHKRIHAGQSVYREGDRFQNLYAVRSGTIKLAVALADGREHVGRIALPGDLIGMDGISEGTCAATATALEDSDVCSISFTTLHALAAHHAEWQVALCRVMAAEIAREQRHLVMLGAGTTEARVADFLVELADRLEQRGYSGSEFHLRESRAEIGSYLGLTLETVSRTLSSFQQSGWIVVRKRHIRIVAMEPLRRLAGRAALTREVRRAA
jgi:CRP/FNR family transcriptional regulator